MINAGPKPTLVLLAWLPVMLLSCAFPQKFWPQKDMHASDHVFSDVRPAVLVASRSSEYKHALLEKLSLLMEQDRIGFKVIGVEMLKTVDALDYDAVVIINTCLAWGYDENVQGFIDRQPRHDHMIILTTSGKGDWRPREQKHDFDAMSAASNPADADRMARTVADKLNAILKK
jgi:hypothetical protein